MKTYNSPEQTRNLREIEAAAASPVINTITQINGTIQSVSTPKKEEGEEKKTQDASKKETKKTRTKKDSKEI